MKDDDIKYTTRKGSLGLEIYVADPLSDGYTAYFAEFPGIITEGITIETAQENLWNMVFDILKSFAGTM